MKQDQYRQGDVFLLKVGKLPEGAKELPLDNGRIVLAYGEVTGHAHAIKDHSLYEKEAAAEVADALIARIKARMYEHNGNRYLVVKEAVTLTHEEHDPHTLHPGVYEIPVQVEYSTETIRRVAD